MNTWKPLWKSLFCFNWWDVWYSPYAKPLFPFLFFARIMSTLFILTVPTTRRTTAARHHPRLCLTEPARCPAAGRIQNVKGTSAAATTGASTPAWSPYSHLQVEWTPQSNCGREKHAEMLAVIAFCPGSQEGGMVWVWVEDKALVPCFWFLGWLLNQEIL